MDKRTKEYKEWKKRQDAKSKGLGDDVAKVTKATGIDKLVKFVAGEDVEAVEIKGFEGYFITKDGTPYSTRSRWGSVKPTKCKVRLQNGYPSFSAYPTGEGKRSKTVYIHRVVGESFLPKPKNKSTDELTINHKNGNREDNSLDNLEWVTLKENIQHSFMELNDNRVASEIVLDVLKMKHVDEKTNEEILKETQLSKDTIEGILYKGSHIYKDNIKDVATFYKENELEPNKAIKEKIWDCGCDERQEQLNKVFSYDVPECLTEDEFNYLTKFFNNPPEIVSVDVQKRMLAIHNRIFKEQKQPSSCASCVKQTFKKLEKVLNNY
jgi:hypothetical protein